MTTWRSGGRLAGLCGMTALLLAGDPVGSDAKTVVIQKTTIYVATLPRGCVKTTYSGGVVVWRCGKLYYQPYNGRYVRVYIN